MEISERIRSLRKKRKLTQIGLSEISGISQQAISNIESGRNAPSESTLRMLAAALNCTIDDFYNDKPVKKEIGLSDDERELLHIYRQLNQAGRQLLMESASSYLAQPALRQEGSMSSAE